MMIAKTRTFRSGNSEAVWLPKYAALGEGVELVVVRSGNVVTLYPATTSIPEMTLCIPMGPLCDGGTVSLPLTTKVPVSSRPRTL
jgi:virulence-associated protein VagC